MRPLPSGRHEAHLSILPVIKPVLLAPGLKKNRPVKVMSLTAEVGPGLTKQKWTMLDDHCTETGLRLGQGREQGERTKLT